jgi:ankyrin repeat protein
MISWLAENGADVNWVDGKHRETPVFYRIKLTFGNVDNETTKAQKLLSLGADVNFRNVDGLTPLNFAVRKCSISLTKTLLDHGMYINSIKLPKKAALHHVFHSGVGSLEIRETVVLFIQHGAAVNARDSARYTPRHIAVTKR